MLNSLKYNLQTNLQLERHIVPWRFPVFPKNPKRARAMEPARVPKRDAFPGF